MRSPVSAQRRDARRLVALDVEVGHAGREGTGGRAAFLGNDPGRRMSPGDLLDRRGPTRSSELLVPGRDDPDVALEAALAARAPRPGLARPRGRAVPGPRCSSCWRGMRRHGDPGDRDAGRLSTIWLARACPRAAAWSRWRPSRGYAEVARANIARAGLADVVELRVGPALETLPAARRRGRRALRLIFIDADKREHPEYLAVGARALRPGSLIVADNVVRGGAVVDAGERGPRRAGLRRFLELLAAEPRVGATAIQTVGSKGHDGIAIALVIGDPGP